jgi:hypothetical protein
MLVLLVFDGDDVSHVNDLSGRLHDHFIDGAQPACCEREMSQHHLKVDSACEKHAAPMSYRPWLRQWQKACLDPAVGEQSSCHPV